MENFALTALDTVAKIGLVVFGLSLAYAWRVWALDAELGN